MSATLHARRAAPADAPMIAQIYSEGIADRVATFETSPRSAEDVRAWFDGVHPIVVVEGDRSCSRACSSRTWPAATCCDRSASARSASTKSMAGSTAPGVMS